MMPVFVLLAFIGMVYGPRYVKIAILFALLAGAIYFIHR